MFSSIDKLYYYQNFSLPEAFASMDFLIWGVFAGILIGAVVATIDKLYSSAYVKALVHRGADRPEAAVTLNDLDIRGKWYLRWALRNDKPLRKMLACAGENSQGVKAAALPLYLPAENRAKAEIRFDNGEHPIRTLILALAALTAVAFFARFAIPELLTMLDNFIGSI